METTVITESKDVKVNLLQRINNGFKPVLESELEQDGLKNLIEKEIPTSEAIEKLQRVKEDRIKVKELVIESEIDFVKSVKQLQTVYNQEFENMVRRVNDLYNSELLKLKQLYRKTVVGEPLIEMVNAVSIEGWVLVMKESSVNLYKCYNPGYFVTTGFHENGEIHEFDEPVTELRGIYVNILHPKITTGTIHIAATGGQHPNCDHKNFGQACPGTLDDREIPISDTGALILLLKEISTTYEQMHLDSAYYCPTGSYQIIEKGKQWTT